jgi:peptidoglycan/xylan/chitin deacetylase (PgdA/CDA1 family)
MYHYVRNSNKEFPYFRYLSVDNFSKQLDYFQSNHGFVTFDNLLNIKNKDYFNNTKNKVLLTFDDGFKDHYKYVLPELIKRKLFGIFYVPTGVYEKEKALDVHRIHYLLGKIGGKILINLIESKIDSHMIKDEEYNLFKKTTYTNQDNDFYTQEFKKIFNYYIKYEYREKLLDLIVAEFSTDKEIFSNLYMDKEQLKEMADNGMIIGSHSINHFVFSKLSNEDQSREISDSFSFIENIISNLDIKTFCYPYGGFHTFTDFTENTLSENGCDFSFNVESRDVTYEDIINRSQALPRYDCNQFEHGKANLG